MKTQLKNVLTSKVHCVLFVLACLLLAGVVLGAKIMADRISADFVVSSDEGTSPTLAAVDT